MSIKYVENYRAIDGSMNDTVTIQTAVDSLVDGDTLVFESGRTYVLDEPIQLTSYKQMTDELGNIVVTGYKRGFLTIDGQGCTIKNSSTFVGYTVPSVSSDNEDVKIIESLFITSDIDDNYIRDTHIKNFYFEEVNRTGYTAYLNKFGELTNRYLTAISVGPANPSPGVLATYSYLLNSKITNCSFKKFKQGIELGGEDNIVQQCKFENCSYGINCDCTNQAYIYHNHFFCTNEYGIRLTQPYRTKVYYNYFYHCMNYFIEVDGTSKGQNEIEIISLSICSNTLIGGKVNGLTRNQNGICLSGVKNAMVKDNFIYDMNYLTADTLNAEKEANPNKTHGAADSSNSFGCGILVDGVINDSKKVYRYSEKVIVSGNEITGCMRYGIKIDLSARCQFFNNSVYCSTYEDYDIYIGDNTGDLSIYNNTLYHYDADKMIRASDYGTNNYNITLYNNMWFNSDKTFNPLSPIRFIDTSVVFGETIDIISIPNLDSPLETNEEFEMLVPEDYNCLTVSYVSYNGMTGNIVDKENFDPINISQYKGQYVRMQYKYYEKDYGDYIRFIFLE